MDAESPVVDPPSDDGPPPEDRPAGRVGGVGRLSRFVHGAVGEGSPLRRPYLLTLLVLVLADLVLAAVFLRPFLPGPGPLVFGDLPAIYTYGGVDPHWVLTLSLYQASEQLLALAIPWTTAQNVVYVATFLLPSLGIYYFLAPFTRFPALAGVVAFSTGTIVNPVFISDFVRGGEEYGLWLLFAFLGFGLLCAPPVRGSTRWWEPVAAGLCFGLSSTQTFGLTGVDTAGVLLSGPPLVGVLLYRLARTWEGTGRRRSVLEVLTFLGAYGILLAPLVLSDLTQTGTVLGSASQTAFLASHAVGNAQYTFRPYGFAAALLTLPPTATASGYTVVLVPLWVAIVILSLIGSAWTFASQQGPVKWLSGIFLLSYLGFAGILAGVNSGAFLPVYRSVPPLDLFDGPDLFVYAQLLCLPFLFLAFLLLVVERPLHLPTFLRLAPPAPVAGTPGDPSAASPHGRWSPARAPSTSTVAVLLALFLAAAVIASAAPADQSLRATMFQNPAVYPDSPFAPASLVSVRDWYASANPAVSGFVLPLPDDYLSYSAFEGVVPLPRMWIVPLYAPQLAAGYNTTAYVEVMDSLANGSVSLWAAQIGSAGVQYVVLQDRMANISVVPSYLDGGPGPVPYSTLVTELTTDPDFVRTFDGGGVSVFLDRLFLGAGSSSPGLSTFAPSPAPVTVASGAGLPGGGFSNWSLWPPGQTNVRPNGSASIQVNTSASPDYVVLWGGLLGASPEPATNASTNQSVGLNVTYAQVRYTFQDRLVVPNGTRLQAYAAWYNSTDPASLFAWVTTTNIGDYYAGVANISADLTVPAGAVLGRVIYTAFPDAPQVSSSIYATAPTAVRTVSTLNLSTDGDAEYEVSQALTQVAAMPNGSTFLFTPSAQNLAPSFPAGAYETSIAPAGAFDPQEAPVFAVPLQPGRFPVASYASETDSAGLLLTGTVSSAGSLALTVGGSTQSLSVVPGRLDAWFRLSTSDLGEIGSVSLEGNLTLGLLGLVLGSTSLTGGSAAPLSIGLPIGSVSGSLGPNGLRIASVTTPLLSSSAEFTPSDLIPIPALAVLVLMVYRVETRRREPTRADDPSRQN
jgi:hypothetical protein